MKLKLGFLSTQRYANYGSVLQCYALEKKLNQIGYDAEIIDYFPEDATIAGQLRQLKGKSEKLKNPMLYCAAICAFSISYIKKKLVFDKFIKKNLQLSSKTYHDATKISDSDPYENIYCCGGDQTLNGFKVLDVFDRLPESAIKVSYSSSFGKTEFTKDELEHERKSLSRFNALSCREDSGIQIMYQMGFDHAQQMIDPVFLLNVDEWRKLASEKYKGKKFVVAYNLHHDKGIEQFQRELSKKYHLPVINICMHWFEFYRYGQFRWCPNVEDFLSLIMNAEYVVSDSFHATSFCLLFHKKFITIVPEKVGTRIESILKLFEMTDRMVQQGQYEQALSAIDCEIDYDRIDRIINDEREKAVAYIQSWKGICQNEND